jgi:hypothetical protein
MEERFHQWRKVRQDSGLWRQSRAEEILPSLEVDACVPVPFRLQPIFNASLKVRHVNILEWPEGAISGVQGRLKDIDGKRERQDGLKKARWNGVQMQAICGMSEPIYVINSKNRM